MENKYKISFNEKTSTFFFCPENEQISKGFKLIDAAEREKAIAFGCAVKRLPNQMFNFEEASSIWVLFNSFLFGVKAFRQMDQELFSKLFD